MDKTELVAAYVRVSTQEQKLHGISLDAQKAKLQAYAEAHNMKIVGWYVDEGVSGRKLIKNRPELQRMIQDAEQGKFERIIFIKLDRFFRSVAEYHECMKRISPTVWTTTEEEYDLTTANGRMLVNMKLTIAELEADMAGERIDIVNEYKASTGQPLTGSMPLSHKITKDALTGRKKIIRDPEKEPAVRDVLDYYMTHQNLRKAVVYLRTKYHISISYNSLKRLLQNPMLCGEYRENKKYCEAYMTREQFDKLQELMGRNVKCNTEKRDYLFSGLIKCPNCGRRLAGNTSVLTRGSGKVYRYKKYRCPNHATNANCDFSKSVSEATFERLMLEDVEKCFEDAKIDSVKIKGSNAEEIPQFNISEIYEQIDRLNYSWQTGKIRKVEQYEKDYADLMEKLEKAEAERGETAIRDFSKIEAILHDGWTTIYSSLDDAHKRAFWRSFVQSVEIEWTTCSKTINRIKFF